MIVELIAAAVGTIAFCLLYSVPPKHYLACGLIGMAAWLFYGLTTRLGLSSSMAVFAGTLVAVLLSRAMAVRRQCPATVFMITGVFPLVPGAQIYWAAYYLVTNQFDLALNSGFSALKAMIAIVLGIIFVFEIPNKAFVIFRRKTPKQQTTPTN